MHTQEQETERKYKFISGSSTAIFFILLSLLLWYIKFSKPEKDEIPEELSVAVALEEGASGGGGGSEGGPSDEVPVDVSSPSVPQMSLPSPSTEQTKDETAVPVKPSNPNPNRVPEMSEDEKMRKEMEEAAKQNKSKKPTGGGNGPDFGDGGSGGGTGGGNGSGNGPGKGPGSGNGPGGNGYGLEGFGTRGLNGYRKAPDNCNRPGTIKLSITVRADGTIVDMDPVTGYDIDNCLIERAKACLKNAKFDQTTNNKLVTGIITIKFTQQ